MADLATLERALRAADAAGDTNAASALAAEYQRAQGQQWTLLGPPPPMEEPEFEAPRRQLPEVQPMVRAMVGMLDQPEQRMGVLRQFFPQAMITPDGDNFVIDDPVQGKLQYNTPGIGRGMVGLASPQSMGDIASIGPEAAELLGGTVGAVTGAPAGPFGSAAAGGFGAAAGKEAYRQGVGPLLEASSGVQLPQRSLGEVAADAGTTALLNAGGQLGGELVGYGLRWAGKALFRGGKEGGRQFAQAVSDANRWGVPISVGEAANNAWAVFDQMAGTAARRTRQDVEKAAGEQVTKLAQSIGRGRGLTYESVGKKLQAGVETFSKRMRTTGHSLDQDFFDLVAKDTQIPVPNTVAAIQRVLPDLPSMPATAAAERASPMGQRMMRLLDDIRGGGGALQFADVRTFRGQLGEMLKTGSLVPGEDFIKLSDLHKALTADLGEIAHATSPAAEMAWKRAQTYWAKELKTLEDVIRPLVVKNVPSEIARALEGKMAKAPEYVREIMRTLSPEQREVIRASTIRKLGMVSKSGQGAAGETWSFTKFLSDWNGLDRTVRNTLFKDRGYLSALDALARTSEAISKRTITEPPIPKYMVAGAIGSAALTGVGMASGIGPWLMLPVGFALTSGAAQFGQRLMRNRAFVNWLAKTTTARPAGLGAHIGRLGAIAENSDPQTKADIKEFLDFLSQHDDDAG